MPRPLLDRKQSVITMNTVYQAVGQQENQRNKLELNRMLRASRSKKYIEAMKKLDSGGPVMNHDQVEQLLQQVRAEFPNLDIPELLLGIVSVCYLGRPYEVHTLDITGGIIEHYKRGEGLPCGLEKARSLALQGSYAFVEVYSDCCRAVSESGSVSVVMG